MKNLNKKGFALVETLIVSVFVMSIFTLMYTNFFPMIGEYERREKYDDIDSVYKTYLIKRLFEDQSVKSNYYTWVNFNFKREQINDHNRPTLLDCNVFSESQELSKEKREYCKLLFEKTNVYTIYLASYNLTSLKSNIPSSFDSRMKDYVNTLPNYTKTSQYKYRIIVEYKTTVNTESGEKVEDVYSFSTIGVDF